MRIPDRVAELLAGVPPEETLRGREVSEGAAFLGLSEATVYRAISDGRLGHVKLEGSRRRGHGCAGAVRVRLVDLVRFQVENERLPGAGLQGESPRLVRIGPAANAGAGEGTSDVHLSDTQAAGAAP